MQLALAALVLVLASAGCGGEFPQAPPIPNPLRAGTLRANTVVVWQSDDAHEHGLPVGSLASRASLIALDAREVCIDVRTRTLAVETPPTGLARWSYRLDVGARRGVATAPTIASDGRDVVTTALGFAWAEGRRFVEDRLSCVPIMAHRRGRNADLLPAEGMHSRHGQICGDRVVTEYQDEPVPLEIHAQHAVVCFAHHGAIDRTTTRLALEMTPPHGGTDPLRWAWDFLR